MKELIWSVACSGAMDAYFICNSDSAEIIAKDGNVYSETDAQALNQLNIYFWLESEAQEFMEEMCDEQPDLMYKRIPQKFITDELAEEIITSYMDSVVTNIVEALMDKEMTFTRHDVLKVIRQLVGPDVEIDYADWKSVIVETLADKLDEYGYEVEFKLSRFKYSPIPEEEEDEEDEPETQSVDNATTSTMTVDPTPVPTADTSEPERVRNRHIFKAEQVRKFGGSPGAKIYIIVCKGRFFIEADADKNVLDWSTAGCPAILLNTSLTVDKYCNLRVSKYIFDLAGMTRLFGKDLDILFQ